MEIIKRYAIGSLTILCFSFFLFTCEKAETTTTTEAEQIFTTAKDGQPECTGHFFAGLTDDESAILTEIGLEAFLAEYDLGDCEDYYGGDKPTRKKDYCNYVVVQILEEGGGGPAILDGFCVDCPPLCAKDGILWSPNGYRARVIRDFLTRADCTTCLNNVVYPRKRKP